MPSGRFSGCANCHGRCCYHYVVPITGYDAHLIASQSLLAIEQFAVVVPEEHPSPLGFLLDEGTETFVLALDKNQEARGKRKPCVFLLSLPDGEGRCGIYRIRPLVCQTYPAMLHHGGVTVREDVICDKGSWNIAAMDLPEWRLSLLRTEMENAIYRIVVAHWNRTVTEKLEAHHACEHYFSYLMDVYERIEGIRQSYSDVMPQIIRRWGSQAHSGVDEAHSGVDESASALAPRSSWRRFFNDVESTVVGPSVLRIG